MSLATNIKWNGFQQECYLAQRLHVAYSWMDTQALWFQNSAYEEAPTLPQVVLRFASTMHGVRFVMTTSISMLGTWYARNWDTSKYYHRLHPLLPDRLIDCSPRYLPPFYFVLAQTIMQSKKCCLIMAISIAITWMNGNNPVVCFRTVCACLYPYKEQNCMC